MKDQTTSRTPMPPILWWIFGTVAACFLVLWHEAGVSRALWWLGLLLGSTAIAVVTMWIKDSIDYESGAHILADLVSRLFWLASAFIFLFGVIAAGRVILGPVFSAFSGSDRYYKEPPENWRR